MIWIYNLRKTFLNEIELVVNVLLNGLDRAIGLMRRVFANGPGDRGSIQSYVIPKTLKMVPDAALLNTQHYMVRIKSKVEQSRERCSTLPYTSL